ncbi:caldesmon, smooth muscle-like [Notothenia coriiceps]|uniref:Caldesmon, smooth muscle-like n=1 Tax=Notothenia coriiceps TaxID=8208 RepID=A0A6I9N6C6_9TELE|nr:PREDICTED: caldesmon, smooth muscle-like [Notothenia coriiceps]
MDDDFDRRMELRRQRREQMRVETDKPDCANDDDEEEAREQRRRAREERKKGTKESEESGGPEVIDTNRYEESAQRVETPGSIRFVLELSEWLVRSGEEEEKKEKEEKPKKFGFKDKNEPAKLNTGLFENKLKKTEKSRQNDAESEDLEKMKQKTQSAEAELEELKKKREDRRKIVEEEDKLKKQQLEDKKAKEQEERKRMKEEIEKRRAEAAEKKKQKEEESPNPVLAITPKGSSKIGAKAEFLSKSAQKSTTARASHSPIVSKIGNRMEQYNSAILGNKDVKSPKSPMADIPTGGARSIKSMWEKGNVGGSSESPAPANKDLAGIKGGVTGRVNSWMAKPPEAEKTAAPAPAQQQQQQHHQQQQSQP